MPTPSTAHLLPPKSWDEFEDICADLFSHMWGDPNAIRYGRQGQRQHGVDIYGNARGNGTGAVQCKGRRKWPPKALTTSEIDDEVEKAKRFKPPLVEFTIATVGQDDVKLQDHARAITEFHKTTGLFSVYVVGWGEITRRLTQYEKLVDKHFGYLSVGNLREDIKAIPDVVADVVVERLREIDVVPGGATPNKLAVAIEDNRALQDRLNAALDRDLAQRFNHALQRAFFPEATKVDGVRLLGREIVDRGLHETSQSLRRKILLQASRIAAVRGDVTEAEAFLTAARTLSGPDSETAALARLEEARGAVEEAVKLLRDSPDPEARAVLVNILVKHRGLEAAISWLNAQHISTADLPASGVHSLVVAYLEREDFDKAMQELEAIRPDQLSACPHLLFLRGVVRIGSLFAKPERKLPLMGFPLDVRAARVTTSTEVASAQLDLSIADLNQFLPVADTLGLRMAHRIAESQLTWCHLLHPARQGAALVKLRGAMSDPATALPRLHFALAYDDQFDPAPVKAYLKSREEFGGLDDEELRAAFVLQLHANEPRALAEFIAGHRSRLETAHGKGGVVAIEVQALALANDVTSAQLALEQNKAILDGTLVSLLQMAIAKASGSDPVAEYKKTYEATKSVEALRALVGELIRRKDHRAIAHYAEQLFKETGDPQDAVVVAQAFASAGEDQRFIEVFEALPLLKDSEKLVRHYAWKLLEVGRVAEAHALVMELRVGKPKSRDLDLEIAVAIESGDWESLAFPLATYLDASKEHSGLALIRAARIAQTAGKGSYAALLSAAISRAPDNPQVLINAYAMVVETGLEEKKPEAQEWLLRALDLSGPDGPVKRFELKDLLPQHAAWAARSNAINSAVTRGDLPLAFAARGLRTTLVDVLLANLVRNSTVTNPRARVGLPLFSGRARAAVPKMSRLAIDISSMMVLGWLRLLPNVFGSYSSIKLAAGALGELFEGQARLIAVQKSRVNNAKAIQAEIARGRLKIHRSEISARDPLAQEVGGELSSLLQAAKTAGGFVVHPAPVRRPNLEREEVADLSAFSDVLVDMQGVLDVIASNGAIEQGAEETARRYFALQDKRWPSAVELQVTKPLFIDSLALTYLQYVHLLDAVLTVFPNAYVDSSVERTSAELLDYERNSAQVLEVVEEIRNAVKAATKNGKVSWGPQRSLTNESDGEPGRDEDSRSSTLNLLSDLGNADAVLFDDRALNKEPNAEDVRGLRIPLITSIQVIDDLVDRQVLSEAQTRGLRHRLRVGGAVLIPTDPGEILSAALRNKQAESPEFRGIRENVSLSRISRIPAFPADMPWYGGMVLDVQRALMRVWEAESDLNRARQLSDAIWALRPDPTEWAACWGETPPPDWHTTLNAILLASMALPFELEDGAKKAAYNAWLEERVLAPLKETRPTLYQRTVQRVMEVLLTVVAGANERRNRI